MTTELDNLIQAAVITETERRRLTSLRKVSAKGFIADAMLLAGEPSDERVAELRARLEASHGPLVALVRRLAAYLIDACVPCLPVRRDKLERMFRLFWVEGVDAELTDLGLSRWDALVLAVLRATETHGDRFGGIASWQEHQDALARCNDKLNDLIAAMKTAFNARDVVWQKPSPAPAPAPPHVYTAADLNDLRALSARRQDSLRRERFLQARAARSELPGPWLVKFPSISLADPAWPTKVIEQAMIGLPATAETETEQKPKKDKLAKRAKQTRERESKSKSAKIKRRRPAPQVVGPLTAASADL